MSPDDKALKPMSLQALMSLLLHRLNGIILLSFCFWTFASLFILLHPQVYRAQALIVPAETTGIAVSNILSSPALVAPQLFDSKPSGNFAVYLGALRTREMATALRNHTRLAEALTQDAEASWINRLQRNLGLHHDPVSDDVLVRWLERNTSATPQPNSIIWSLEVRHPNRDLALAVLQTLHTTAEARVREEIAGMVSRRLTWLTQRASFEQDATIRAALYDLIGQANRQSAILQADTAIAARIVSAPSVEERASFPNRLFLLSLALVASSALSISFWTSLLIFRYHFMHVEHETLPRRHEAFTVTG